MKIVQKIATIILTAFILTMCAVFVLASVTAPRNHGVPKIFGYQFLVVQTDSMEPTLKVGTGVIVKEIKAEEYRPREVSSEGEVIYEGDIITFVRSGLVITHRLLNVEVQEDGRYRFEAFGDNLDSSQCGSSGCEDTPHDFFYAEDAMGKVVQISDFLGGFYTFMSQPIVFVASIGLPLSAFIIITIVDYRKSKKAEKEGDQS